MALEKITSVSGKAVYVPGSDIDTDRIIPARFMKCVTFDGLGEYLFYDVRHEQDGTPKPHPLTEERFSEASNLIFPNLSYLPEGDFPTSCCGNRRIGPYRFPTAVLNRTTASATATAMR